MATQNVINEYKPGKPTNLYMIRETDPPDAVINQQLRDLLDRPAWPQLPDGVWLKAGEAAQLYRTSYAIAGLARMISNAASSRGNAQLFNDRQSPIGETEQSQLHAALIELSVRLTGFADQLHVKASGTH